MLELPPPDDLHPSDPDENLVLRMLYDEQQRLKNEIDELRNKQEQQPGKEQQKEDSNKSGGEDSDEKKNEDQDKEQKDEDGDKEKKEEKKPPLKQRLRTWVKDHRAAAIFIVIGFILLLILGWLLWRYLDSYENTDDAFVDGHTDPISPRINGIVVAVYAENTFHVKKGQLLVQLDPRDYVVAKEQANANLAQAQASVRAQLPNVPITETSQTTVVVNNELGVESATANLAAAQQRYRSASSDLEQAEENEANASREEARYKTLVVKEEVSRELYDQRATDARAQAALVASRHATADAAAKAVKEAEASLGQARQRAVEARHNFSQQIAIQQETLAMRQANAKSAQAQADQAGLNLDYTRIVAPDDGVIGDKSVQVGMQVAPGQELLALTQTNDIWITANFKETQIRRMRAGQSVTVHVDALAQNFDGYIEALPGASGAVYSLLPPENATGNYVKVVQRLPVRIRLRQGQAGLERLAPGMSVEPKVWLR